MSRRTKKNVNSEVQLEKKLLGLKKMNSRKLDNLFHESHAKEFKTRDCLACANCCKTTSPIFRDVDINRISKCLGMKSQKFVEQYLRMDEEQDYVL